MDLGFYGCYTSSIITRTHHKGGGYLVPTCTPSSHDCPQHHYEVHGWHHNNLTDHQHWRAFLQCRGRGSGQLVLWLQPLWVQDDLGSSHGFQETPGWGWYQWSEGSDYVQHQVPWSTHLWGPHMDGEKGIAPLFFVRALKQVGLLQEMLIILLLLHHEHCNKLYHRMVPQ